MNIRKTLLLALIVAIASLGLTLAGCEKKSEPVPAEHPAAEHPAETVDKMAESTQKSLEETKAAAEKPAADHPGH
jgi:hypothetical protein